MEFFVLTYKKYSQQKTEKQDLNDFEILIKIQEKRCKINRIENPKIKAAIRVCKDMVKKCEKKSSRISSGWVL